MRGINLIYNTLKLLHSVNGFHVDGGLVGYVCLEFCEVKVWLGTFRVCRKSDESVWLGMFRVYRDERVWFGHV